MFDTQPSFRYFVDLHSFSEDILYNWGDDLNQASKPAMNFRNAEFDGKRGMANDTAYREYFPAADQKVAVALARHMRDAIKAVRGRTYTVMQELSLYPTAGNVNDYAYGRTRRARRFIHTRSSRDGRTTRRPFIRPTRK
jgi:carboxypeptidase T